MRRGALCAVTAGVVLLGTGAHGAPAQTRSDGASLVPISGLKGSLQNPCFSPDGTQLAFTRWPRRYNEGNAVVHTVGVLGGAPLTRVSPEGGAAVNLPGACWNAATGLITFSQELGGPDSVHVAAPDGTGFRRVVGRAKHVTIEPSFSPDGTRVVFESSVYDAEGPGSIWVANTDGTALRRLLGRGDNRQPNWSPRGDLIVFQREKDDDNDLWVIRPDGSGLRNVTRSRATSETDVAFSPDGRRLVYSAGGRRYDIANLEVIGVDGRGRARLTRAARTYDGAPTWSPDGRTVAFESRRGEPDGSAGTRLWAIPVPQALQPPALSAPAS